MKHFRHIVPSEAEYVAYFKRMSKAQSKALASANAKTMPLLELARRIFVL